ncbi:hypothetical protein V6B14_22780 (plasmid) [Sporosarcina psychrophila]|uniref:hypothetical protein n=1 Tax=Sporosarcina psychrophila TaxID=1476 RepID=UPI0030D29901
MFRETKRYIEEAPQRYKVIGYSVKASVEEEKIRFNIKLSKHAPLDVTPFFSQMTFVNL